MGTSTTRSFSFQNRVPTRDALKSRIKHVPPPFSLSLAQNLLLLPPRYLGTGLLSASSFLRGRLHLWRRKWCRRIGKWLSTVSTRSSPTTTARRRLPRLSTMTISENLDNVSCASLLCYSVLSCFRWDTLVRVPIFVFLL